MPDLTLAMKRNALRVAEVWMDEYKHNVNLAWNLPFQVFEIEKKNTSSKTSVAECVSANYNFFQSNVINAAFFLSSESWN